MSRKRERGGKKRGGGGGRGEKTIRLKNLLQTPEELCDWGFKPSSRGSWCISAALSRAQTLPVKTDTKLHIITRINTRTAFGHARPKKPKTRTHQQRKHKTALCAVVPLHLLANTKVVSSNGVQPRPFIPFSKACTTTKAEKLGICVDDGASNLFGGTHYISSLYSLAVERGELHLDIQRWASLWRWAPQQWPAITPGIIHTFHIGQMPRADYFSWMWLNTIHWQEVTH